MLVDDLASELDSHGRSRCLAELNATGAQVFLTAVPGHGLDRSDVDAERLFHVEQGHIHRWYNRSFPTQSVPHVAAHTYDSSNIKVLKGLEAVRKRPGMFIGDTDDGNRPSSHGVRDGRHSIDEALAGYCTEVSVIVHADESVTVSDNGRGIPVDNHEEEDVQPPKSS